MRPWQDHADDGPGCVAIIVGLLMLGVALALGVLFLLVVTHLIGLT